MLAVHKKLETSGYCVPSVTYLCARYCFARKHSSLSDAETSKAREHEHFAAFLAMFYYTFHQQ
jgi:hypothetical protein